jgi:predicted TIM-barrel fold metal-dependent hydrolase
MELLSRRKFLRGATAIGATALVSGSTFGTQRGRSAAGKINIHHHLTAPAYVKFLTDNKLRDFPNRSVAEGLEDMDKAGISTAFTSIIGPGIWNGSAEQTRRLARECNDFAAKLVSDYPGRFGMFASLPLPDIDGSLKEIEYAYETLKADGIYLFTNFGQTPFYGDKYLGDPMLAPIYEELNRRKAIVYTHPKDNLCCRNTIPGVGDPTIEYGTDTTRAIESLLVTGTAAKYPEVRFIFSHGGGTAPFLISRIAGNDASYLREGGKLKQGAPPPRASAALPKGPLYELQKFYYDTASVENQVSLAGLRKLVPMSQIFFGTDFPFGNAVDRIKSLEASEAFNEQELRAIYRDNAVKLLPRLRS